MLLSSLRGQQGVVATFLLTVLAAAGTVILVGFESVRMSAEYNRGLQIATNIREDPNSHSQADVDASGYKLLAFLLDTVQQVDDCPDCVPPPECCIYLDARATADGNRGPGLTETLTAVAIQQQIRTRTFIIKSFVGPAIPLAGVDVTVTVTVLKSDTNTPVPAETPVSFTFFSPASPPSAGVRLTDAAGTIQFHVKGGKQGTTEEFTFTIGGVRESLSYRYH